MHADYDLYPSPLACPGGPISNALINSLASYRPAKLKHKCFLLGIKTRITRVSALLYPTCFYFCRAIKPMRPSPATNIAYVSGPAPKSSVLIRDLDISAMRFVASSNQVNLKRLCGFVQTFQNRKPKVFSFHQGLRPTC